jgi:hypothetical protein
MKHRSAERLLVTIFRDGEPSILGISQIEGLSKLPIFSDAENYQEDRDLKS